MTDPCRHTSGQRNGHNCICSQPIGHPLTDHSPHTCRCGTTWGESYGGTWTGAYSAGEVRFQ